MDHRLSLRYFSEHMTPSANTTPVGGPAAGGFCAACGAALSAGARFCHRCGTPVGQGAPSITHSVAARSNSSASILPWAVAFVAILALVANFAGKNFAKAKGAAVDGSANSIATSAVDGPAAAQAGGRPAGAPPDISSMSPSERANRLFQRIMSLAENNKMDSAAMFTQMGIPAHQAIENPTIDERFHLALIAEIARDTALARAESDTILAQQPNNLLGLLSASRAALLNGNSAKAKKFDQQLLKVLESELATNNLDYQQHRADIDRAAAGARTNK